MFDMATHRQLDAKLKPKEIVKNLVFNLPHSFLRHGGVAFGVAAIINLLAGATFHMKMIDADEISISDACDEKGGC